MKACTAISGHNVDAIGIDPVLGVCSFGFIIPDHLERLCIVARTHTCVHSGFACALFSVLSLTGSSSCDGVH